MGRRDRRRHAAALGGGSRRVKLDLWNDEDAENKAATVAGKVSEVPQASEDNGDAVEKQAGFLEGQAQDARGLPSGAGDPLSLLVQYSDDEEDEVPGTGVEAALRVVQAGVGQAAHSVDEQILSFMAELETSGLLKENEDGEKGADAGSALPLVSPENVEAGEELTVCKKGVDARDGNDVVNVDDETQQMPLESAEAGEARQGTEHKSCPDVTKYLRKDEEDRSSKSDSDQSEHQAGGDWEAVLDEGSGEYFFWNVKTGETTWDKPHAMEKNNRKRKRKGDGRVEDVIPEDALVCVQEQQVDQNETNDEASPLKITCGDERMSPHFEEPEDSGESLVTLPDWEAVLDETSGEYFFWNVETGETVWDKPKGKRSARKRKREAESPGGQVKAEPNDVKNELKQIAVDDLPVDKVIVEDLPVGKMVVEDLPVGKVVVEDLPVASHSDGNLEGTSDKKMEEEFDLTEKGECGVAEGDKAWNLALNGGKNDESERGDAEDANEDAEDANEDAEQCSQSGDSTASQPEWEKVLDEESGDHYYWNVKTGETTWEEPEGMEQQLQKAPPSETLSPNGEDRGNMYLGSETKAAGQAEGSGYPHIPEEGFGVQDVEKGWSERNGEGGQDLDEHICQRSGLEGSVGGNATGMSGESGGDQLSLRMKGRSRARELRSDSTSERRKRKGVGKSGLEKLEVVSGPQPIPVELVARAEAVAEKAKHAAGSALRTLPSLVRFAIEAEIRAADCRTLLTKPRVGEGFWRHVESQLQRLDVVFAVETLAEEASRAHDEPLVTAPEVEHHKGVSAIPLQNAPVPDVPLEMEFDDRPVSSDGMLKRISEVQKKPAVGNWRQRLAARRQVLTAYSDTSADTLEEGEIQSDVDGPKGEQDFDVPMLPPVEEEIEEGEIAHSKADEATTDTIQADVVDINTIEDVINALPTTVHLISATTDTTQVDAMDINMSEDATDALPTNAHLTENTTLILPVPDVNVPLPTPIPPPPTSDDINVPPPPPPDEDWAPPPPLDSGVPSSPPLPDDIPIPEEPPLPESPPLPPPIEDVSCPPPLPPDLGNEMVAPTPPAEYFQCDAMSWDQGIVPASEDGVGVFPSPNVVLPKGVVAAAPVLAAYSGSLFPISSYGVDFGEQALEGAVSARTFGGAMGEDVPLVADYPKEGNPTQSVIAAPAKKTEKDKVLKLKKRAPVPVAATTSKANKKVFSMLDKWKAAKEELHDKSMEQEVEEDMFNGEHQQKKKLKEIENWRIQQIESGQALDNANFQPLEGDWRQRVQRAKKQAAKVASKEVAELAELQEPAETQGEPQAEDASASEAGEGGLVLQAEKNRRKKKPDIKGLSLGLPTGWKAFWDKESGEVYYGNLTTKETSWERPTA